MMMMMVTMIIAAAAAAVVVVVVVVVTVTTTVEMTLKGAILNFTINSLHHQLTPVIKLTQGVSTTKQTDTWCDGTTRILNS